MAAESLASRVSSQVPSTDLINRFGTATEAARVAVEEASTSYKELLAKLKAEQARTLQNAIDEGMNKLEMLTDQLSRWSTILSRWVGGWSVWGVYCMRCCVCVVRGCVRVAFVCSLSVAAIAKHSRRQAAFLVFRSNATSSSHAFSDIKNAEKAIATAKQAQPKVLAIARHMMKMATTIQLNSTCLSHTSCCAFSQSASVSLQQTKLEKFNTLIATAESAVGTVATAVQAEMAALISESCETVTPPFPATYRCLAWSSHLATA